MSDESAGLEKVMGWLETLTQSQSNVIHCIVCMRWVYTEYNSIKEKKKNGYLIRRFRVNSTESLSWKILEL